VLEEALADDVLLQHRNVGKARYLWRRVPAPEIQRSFQDGQLPMDGRVRRFFLLAFFDELLDH
jgi:hypothetical protein